MTCVFSIDFTIHATAYVKADDEESALAIVQRLGNDGFELDGMMTIEGVPLSGAQFDDPELPELSISPAMSISAEDIRALDENDVELVEELNDEESTNEQS